MKLLGGTKRLSKVLSLAVATNSSDPKSRLELNYTKDLLLHLDLLLITPESISRDTRRYPRMLIPVRGSRHATESDLQSIIIVDTVASMSSYLGTVSSNACGRIRIQGA